MKYGFAVDKMLTGGVFFSVPVQMPLSKCNDFDIRFDPC